MNTTSKKHYTSPFTGEQWTEAEYFAHKANEYKLEKKGNCTRRYANGFLFSIVGEAPTGREYEFMIKHAKGLNLSEGTFKMQVTKDGWLGTTSTVNFKKI